MNTTWWKVNTFIWAGCATMWFWIGYIVPEDAATCFVVATWCAILACITGWFAQDE